MANTPNIPRICLICARPLTGTNQTATTCNAGCRMKKYRALKKLRLANIHIPPEWHAELFRLVRTSPDQDIRETVAPLARYIAREVEHETKLHMKWHQLQMQLNTPEQKHPPQEPIT